MDATKKFVAELFSKSLEAGRKKDERRAFVRVRLGNIEQEVAQLLEEYFEPTDDSSFQAEAIAAAGSDLGTAGKYVLERRLGQGVHGNVFLARDTKDKKYYALKVLKLQPGETDAELSDRLTREVDTLKGVGDKNIAHIIEWGKDPKCDWGNHFYVMRYVPGEDLATRLKRVKLRWRNLTKMPVSERLKEGRLKHPERTGMMLRRSCFNPFFRVACLRGLPHRPVLTWMGEAAAGLAALHKENIRHRDFKPSNIVVNTNTGSDEDEVSLTDFGLASDRRAAPGGSYYFMAPEHIASLQYRHDHIRTESDVFSFGCVLYRLLTGNYFIGDLAEVSRVIPDQRLAEEVTGLIRKCCRFSPKDRYKNGTDLFKEYKKILLHLKGSSLLDTSSAIINVENDFLKELLPSRWLDAFNCLVQLVAAHGGGITLVYLQKLRERAIAESCLVRAEEHTKLELNREVHRPDLLGKIEEIRQKTPEQQLEYVEDWLERFPQRSDPIWKGDQMERVTNLSPTPLVPLVALIFYLQMKYGATGRLIYLESKVDQLKGCPGASFERRINRLERAAKKYYEPATNALVQLIREGSLSPNQIRKMKNASPVFNVLPEPMLFKFSKAFGFVVVLFLLITLPLGYVYEKREQSKLEQKILEFINHKDEPDFMSAWEAQLDLLERPVFPKLVMKKYIMDMIVDHGDESARRTLEKDKAQEELGVAIQVLRDFSANLSVSNLKKMEASIKKFAARDELGVWREIVSQKEAQLSLMQQALKEAQAKSNQRELDGKWRNELFRLTSVNKTLQNAEGLSPYQIAHDLVSGIEKDFIEKERLVDEKRTELYRLYSNQLALDYVVANDNQLLSRNQLVIDDLGRQVDAKEALEKQETKLCNQWRALVVPATTEVTLDEILTEGRSMRESLDDLEGNNFSQKKRIKELQTQKNELDEMCIQLYVEIDRQQTLLMENELQLVRAAQMNSTLILGGIQSLVREIVRLENTQPIVEAPQTNDGMATERLEDSGDQ